MTNRKPLVSVIVDTYNNGRFIEEAIDSVLNQNFPQKEMEIIVVDDGSTDDTPEKVKKYKDKIKYIYKENGGQASALNVGFENSRGEIISLLDSDDYFSTEKIETVVEEFETYKQVGIVANGCKKIFTFEDTTEETIGPEDTHNLKIDLASTSKISKIFYITSSISFRKFVLEYILPIPKALRIMADGYLFFSAIGFSNISAISTCLTVYRIHRNNLYSTYNSNRIRQKVDCQKHMVESLKSILIKSERFNHLLINECLRPNMVHLRELEFAISPDPKRVTSYHIEKEKLRINWDDWSTRYRVFKVVILPMYLLLSPRLVAYLKSKYMENELYKWRRLFFPD